MSASGVRLTGCRQWAIPVGAADPSDRLSLEMQRQAWVLSPAAFRGRIIAEALAVEDAQS